MKFNNPLFCKLKIVRKTVDEIVNNSNVLQDDDELKLAVGANEVWFFLLLLLINSSVAADIKIGFSVPSGCTLLWTSSVTIERYYNEESTLMLSGYATDSISRFIPGFIMNGSTTGNLQLRWAQGIQEASNSKVLANSCLFAIKLA